jgi:hypothetical protein
MSVSETVHNFKRQKAKLLLRKQAIPVERKMQVMFMINYSKQVLLNSAPQKFWWFSLPTVPS